MQELALFFLSFYCYCVVKGSWFFHQMSHPWKEWDNSETEYKGSKYLMKVHDLMKKSPREIKPRKCLCWERNTHVLWGRELSQSKSDPFAFKSWPCFLSKVHVVKYLRRNYLRTHPFNPNQPETCFLRLPHWFIFTLVLVGNFLAAVSFHSQAPLAEHSNPSLPCIHPPCSVPGVAAAFRG